VVTEEKIRMDKIRNKIFVEEIRIQNLLIELEEKWLQLSDHLKGMDEIEISRSTLELQLRGKRPMG
jgi:hypothetical protein